MDNNKPIIIINSRQKVHICHRHSHIKNKANFNAMIFGQVLCNVTFAITGAHGTTGKLLVVRDNGIRLMFQLNWKLLCNFGNFSKQGTSSTTSWMKTFSITKNDRKPTMIQVPITRWELIPIDY